MDTSIQESLIKRYQEAFDKCPRHAFLKAMDELVLDRIYNIPKENRDYLATQEELEQLFYIYSFLDSDDRNTIMRIISPYVEEVIYNADTKKICVIGTYHDIHNLCFVLHGICTSKEFHYDKNKHVSDYSIYCEDEYEMFIDDKHNLKLDKYKNIIDYNHPNGYVYKMQWKPFREKIEYYKNNCRDFISDKELEYLINSYNTLPFNQRYWLLDKFGGEIIDTTYNKETNELCAISKVGSLSNLLFVIYGKYDEITLAREYISIYNKLLLLDKGEFSIVSKLDYNPYNYITKLEEVLY